MSHENRGIDERERRLYERLTAYLESGEGEGGPGGHRSAMVADFPEFAGELRDFFDGQERLGRIAARLRRTPPLSSAIEPADPAGPAGTALPRLSEYEVVREISRGGMGVVYAVTHRGLGRAAALKMIRSGELATEEDVRRFREEAQRVAQLDHPHIVPLFEAGHEAGLPYFTMKLMEGGSLADRIAAGRLPLRQAAEVVSRIARAVHFAHQRGILHRDIKPANILFDEDGNPRVGDFGLARPIEGGHSAVRSGLLVGTPMYMAPEQAKRRPALTTAVDIYGLGAVLYELIAGRPPFAADSLLQTLVEVTQSPPRPPPPARPEGRHRPRDHLPEMPGEGTGGAVRLGGGARRRPGSLAPRRADPGAKDHRLAPRRQVGQAHRRPWPLSRSSPARHAGVRGRARRQQCHRQPREDGEDTSTGGACGRSRP